MDNKGHLLNRLQAATDIPRDKAEEAAESVLRHLRERLGPEASDLEAQLPQDVKPMFTGNVADRIASFVTPQDKFHFDEYIGMVAQDAELDRDTAEQVILSVFHELKDHVGDGEARHVAAVLPGDIERVWQRA